METEMVSFHEQYGKTQTQQSKHLGWWLREGRNGTGAVKQLLNKDYTISRKSYVDLWDSSIS